MKTLNKVVTVIAKVAEVCCWVACGFMLLATIFSAVGRPALLKLLGTFDLNAVETNLNSFGFHVHVLHQSTAVYVLFFVTTLLCAALWAMVFRNVYLIFKTTAGETKFSQGATPFQPDNIRMVRELGIFMIAVPVVQLIASVIISLVCGHMAVETSVSFSSVFPGLVVLCLSQYFAYGKELQDETDGLL